MAQNEGGKVLEVESLYKRLGGTVAVCDVNFRAEKSQCVAITGTNGAGKSTLLAMIAGIMRPDRGSVLWDGLAAYGRRGQLDQGCGFVPEAANPPMHLTVSDLLHLVSAIRKDTPNPSVLRDRLELGEIMGAKLDELSLGQRRRACLAAALLGKPPLLVLDEPTNGLDPAGIRVLSEILNEERERGAIIVLATHDLNFATSVQTQRLPMRLGRFITES